MTEKEKLLGMLIEKSGKDKDEIQKKIADKINELSGLVSEEGAIYIIANELGIRLETERPKKNADLTKIEKITEPKTPVSLACKILRIYDKVTFSSQSGTQGSVRSMLVGDETGITRIVFWNEKTELLENLQDGDILKVINAYTRENQNSDRIEIHFGQYSDLEVNPEGINIQVKPMERQEVEYTLKKISELGEDERNVQIKGVITDFDIPRYYFACPECFKKVMQDEGAQNCAEHGEVKAIRVPIINVIVDDGSESISVIAFRDRAQQVTGAKNSEEIIKLTENIDSYKDFTKKIVGAAVEVAGNVSLSSFTGEKQLLINQVVEIEFKSVDDIAEELVNEVSQEKPKEEKKPEKKKEEVEVSEDMDLDIEEIDIDDDLL